MILLRSQAPSTFSAYACSHPGAKARTLELGKARLLGKILVGSLDVLEACPRQLIAARAAEPDESEPDALRPFVMTRETIKRNEPMAGRADWLCDGRKLYRARPGPI